MARYCKKLPNAWVSLSTLLQRKVVNLFRYDSVPIILHPSVAKRTSRLFIRFTVTRSRESDRGRVIAFFVRHAHDITVRV